MFIASVQIKTCNHRIVLFSMNDKCVFLLTSSKHNIKTTLLNYTYCHYYWPGSIIAFWKNTYLRDTSHETRVTNGKGRKQINGATPIRTKVTVCLFIILRNKQFHEEILHTDDLYFLNAHINQVSEARSHLHWCY